MDLPEKTWILIQFWVIIFGAAGSLIFSLLYLFVKKKNSYGWHMWRMSVVLFLVFFVSIIGVLTPIPLRILGPVSTALLVWLTFEVCYRLYLFIRTQVSATRKKR